MIAMNVIAALCVVAVPFALGVLQWKEFSREHTQR